MKLLIHAALLLMLPGCHAALPKPTPEEWVDGTLDVADIAFTAYDLLKPNPAPGPAPLPDAGPGRHWASVPDAPAPRPFPPADAGSPRRADAVRLSRQFWAAPRSCDEVDEGEIAVGEEFECLQGDGLHRIICGSIEDAGWDCWSTMPTDGG